MGAEDLYGDSLETVVAASGRSTVYALGGSTSSEGGSGFAVQGYNVATDSWVGRTSRVDAFTRVTIDGRPTCSWRITPAR